MLRQAENRVKIEGILSEIDLETKTFSKADGTSQEGITGTFTVKVRQEINKEMKELMIPVHAFSYKLTKSGQPNPAYVSLLKVKEEYKSIASTGSEDEADRVRITGATIRMNEYYSQDERLISFPRVNASFVTKIRPEECKPEATFSVEFVVASGADEIGRDGEPTGRYVVKGILPQYGGKVDVIPFYAESQNVIDAVSQYWENGATVKANGRLNFSSRTETTVQEVDFGEPIEQIRTISVSDLIITGGSQTPIDEEFAFDHDEIQSALAERKARLEAQKDRDKSRVAVKATPSPSTKAGFDDLGF